MPSVDTSIELAAPVEQVYDIWTRFERFPEFMSHIEEVRRTGELDTHWVARVAGDTLEWDAKVDLQPNRQVAWTATGDAGHSGRITFDRVGAGRTRMHVHIDYNLSSRLREAVAETFRIDERAIREDLENFARRMGGE